LTKRTHRVDRSIKRVPCWWRVLTVVLIGCLLLPLAAPHALAQPDRAAEILAGMTPEERVGQLFMVPFVGATASGDSDVAELISEYKIGAVALLAANQNFTNDETTPQQIAELSNQLQALALAESPVPLFIAVDHEGDGFPYTRITGGVTPIPSPMQVGATWDTSAAEAVGEIVGRELSAMGINMLLGPTVDVLSNPRPTGKGDIGVRSFGGDPYWVGIMGQAYVQGIHRGSEGRMATVAKHFPGHGGSDRLPDDEVATVDKSLQELRRIELSPFFRLTDLDNAPPEGVTDALMTSHIRYRGFQDDIRQFTAPISFDAESLQTLLGLSEFIHWRDNGGLMVSDSLGVPAVRKYFDPSLSTYPHRRIAREAFLAGNELLILAQFDLNNRWADQFENIKDTAGYFTSEYKSNQAFAARVDAAALRVIRLKLRLYPTPSPTTVLVDPAAALTETRQEWGVVTDIALRSLTRLYPTGTGTLPASPRRDEQVLVISDARKGRDCYDCPYFETLPVAMVEETILRLYGPTGTGQVSPDQISSVSFEDVKRLLGGPLNEVMGDEAAAAPLVEMETVDVAEQIKAADWIIVAALDYNTARYPDSDALKLLLAQGGATLLDKYLVVLALNGPYYLDTTEISKLDAYLCTYSKIAPAVDAAVRGLYGEVVARGSSPVSVDGIGYDLALQLSPAADQPLPVRLVEEVETNPLPPVTLDLAVGPILDANGHPVPDGTAVHFTASLSGSDGEGSGETVTVATVSGIARVEMALTQPGRFEISARAGDAKSHAPLVFEVTASPTPTPTATGTPTVTPTASATAVHTPTAAPSPTATAAVESVTSDATAADADDASAVGTRPLTVLHLLSALAAAVAAALVSYVLRPRPRRRRGWIRRGLVALVGGLVGYLLYGAGLVRPETWMGGASVAFSLLGAAGVAFGGALLALLLDRLFRGEEPGPLTHA
jgi:beta-N-acetylhexosaminidase